MNFSSPAVVAKKYDATDESQNSLQSDFKAVRALMEYKRGEFVSREEVLKLRRKR